MSGLTVSTAVGLIGLHGGYAIGNRHGSHPVRSMMDDELFIVERGYLKMFEGDRQFICGPGEALLLHHGRDHGGVERYPDDLRFFYIHFRRLNPDNQTAEDSSLTLPQQVTLRDPGHAYGLVRKYLADQAIGRLTPWLAALSLGQILEEFHYSSLPIGKQTKKTGSHLAMDANTYLLEHLREPISTSDIARHCHCHPDYLGRIYRQQYGRTISAALQHERMTRFARQLLRDSRSISTVAKEFKFATERHLRQLFKRQFGMSPSAYRRQHGRGHIAAS